MKRAAITRFAPILIALLLAACGDPDPSSSIPTDRFYARFNVETRADGTSEVRADFFERDTFFDYEGVYLDGGDTLEVRTVEHGLLFKGGGNHFVGELASGIAENTRFEFDLQRPVHADAPGSFGTLPAPLDLVLPEAGQEYSVGNDELTVAWQWPGTMDDMVLRVEADCVEPNAAGDGWLDESFSADIPGDPGFFTVRLADRIVLHDECERYETVLKLYRSRRGHVDRAYKPNEAECEGRSDEACRHLEYVSVSQVRSVAIVLRP